MKEHYIGLDIGGTKCAVVLARLNKGIEIIDKIRFDTSKGFDYTYGKLCESIESILDKNSIGINCIASIGVSCGGPLDSRKGIILCPPNLPGWVNIPLVDMLEEKFGVPVFIQNDANACALVEWKLGAGRGSDNMIFLTMGTGMGSGIIAEGHLVVGASNMGGEIGHIRLSQNGPVGYGKVGSFEGFCSGGGIARQAETLTKLLLEQGIMPEWTKDGYAPEEITCEIAATYARQGDQTAKQLFGTVAKKLGEGIAILADAFNPETIVIGSVFQRCEDLLRPEMEKALKEEGIPYAVNSLKVLPAETGDQIGDLASIMVAAYGLGIDPMMTGTEDNPRVISHFKRLFERYPILDVCSDSVMEAYYLIRDCYQHGHKVMCVGNGGSCADCEHIVGELMKGFYLKRPLSGARKKEIREVTDMLMPGIADMLQQGFPAIALTGHPALSTAVQNDINPLLCAAQQVVGFAQKGDILIGISTSGNARNVALAVSTAKALGVKTIGLTGGKGGILKGLCDCTIIAPANTPADVQEYHLPIYHTICAMIEAKFFDE